MSLFGRVRRQARAPLESNPWERGELGHLCRTYQRAIYDDIKLQLWGDGGYLAPTGLQRRFILEIHRRFGKSHVVGLIACELCRVKFAGRVYWAAETHKQVSKILSSILRPILDTCPQRLRPVWHKSDGILRWPGTEAEIHLAGCEDEMKADRLRGDGADLFVIDEAGSIEILQYVYRSIAVWMVSDRDGRVLIPSSPARTPGHPFTAYCIEAEAGLRGGFAHRDVYESAFPAEKIAELQEECGGPDSPDWQREGLAKRVVDESLAILPEFTRMEGQIVQPLCLRCALDWDKHTLSRPDANSAHNANSAHTAPAFEEAHCADGAPFAWAVQRPAYFDPYVTMDLGFDPSLTAIAAGYYDFRAARVVIEGEAELARQTTEDIAAAVRVLELLLFGQHWAGLVARGQLESADAKPWRRISDVQPQVIWDLRRLHALEFIPVRKDDVKEAMINEARLWLRQLRVAIHPRCRRLRAHCRAGIFDAKHRPKFAFVDGFGHFDFCDALIYLVRMIDRQHNPWPELPPADLSRTTAWRKAAREPAPAPKGYEELAKLLPGYRPPR